MTTKSESTHEGRNVDQHSTDAPKLVTIATFLKQKMVQEGLKTVQLAEQLSVHIQTIYNATKGTRPISPKLAIKLSNRFPEPVDFWLRDLVELPEHRYAPVNDIGVNSESATHSIAGNADPILPRDEIEIDLPGAPSSILVDYEVKAMLESNDGAVKIYNFSESNIQSASYDLTVGLVVKEGFSNVSEHDWQKIILDPSLLDEYPLPKGTSKPSSDFLLKPGERATVVAKEVVDFDKKYLARVGGVASNAKKGLLVNHGFQIDPGYQGLIYVTVINIGERPIRLTDAQGVANEASSSVNQLLSLEIYRLERAPKKAHLQDIKDRIAEIGTKTEKSFLGLFNQTQPNDGFFKIEWSAAKIRILEDDEYDAKFNALNQLKTLMVSRPKSMFKNPDFIEPIDRAIESVIVDRKSAKALHRHYGSGDDDKLFETLKCFKNSDSKQTLRDVLITLGLEPVDIAADLLEGDPEI